MTDSETAVTKEIDYDFLFPIITRNFLIQF